jgi:hypothetical protein
MASIANLLRGTDRDYFDFFERAGATVERAGDRLVRMLAGFADTGRPTQDATQPLAIAAEACRDLAIGPESLLDHPLRMMCVGVFGDRLPCRNAGGYLLRRSVAKTLGLGWEGLILSGRRTPNLAGGPGWK